MEKEYTGKREQDYLSQSQVLTLRAQKSKDKLIVLGLKSHFISVLKSTV